MEIPIPYSNELEKINLIREACKARFKYDLSLLYIVPNSDTPLLISCNQSG
jgi:hypothetical protein